MEPDKYLLRIKLAYTTKESGNGLEIMIGNWDKGQVAGEKLPASMNDGKPHLRSLQYRFQLEEAKEDLEFRISNLGGTEIYLNSYSFKLAG